MDLKIKRVFMSERLTITTTKMSNFESLEVIQTLKNKDKLQGF
jgi:hypothetical protein